MIAFLILAVYYGWTYEGRLAATPTGVYFVVLSIVKEPTKLCDGDSIPSAFVEDTTTLDLYLEWFVVSMGF